MSSNLPERAAPKRPRHLMDPANPVRRPVADASTTKVQRWVMTALVMTVAFLLATGWVVIAGTQIDKTVGKWVLLGNSAAFGMAGVAAGRIIHQKKPQSVLLALGLLPAVVGAGWVLR